MAIVRDADLDYQILHCKSVFDSLRDAEMHLQWIYDFYAACMGIFSFFFFLHVTIQTQTIENPLFASSLEKLEYP